MQTIDLTNCDQEPIHIPGATQPHGVLLSVDDDLKILQVSANVEEHLGRTPEDLLDTHLDADLIGQEAFTVLRGGMAGHDFSGLNPLSVVHGDRLFDGVAHRSGRAVVLELEAVRDDARPLHTWAIAAQRSMDRFQSMETLQPLLEATVEEVQRLTGFDRVMAYRFQPDGSGQVVAEKLVREEEESYLGLRYPASDIPAQARRLYTVNLLRLIANVPYQPQPLVPTLDPHTGQPLDMTHSVLRSVSPIHVEYLGNMGVEASMSISLVVGGELWGLVTCHHYQPLYVPYPVRMGCRLIGRTLGLLIERIEKDEQGSLQVRMERQRLEILERARLAEDVVRALIQEQPGLLDLIPAGGVAVAEDNRIVTLGETPEVATVAALVEWLDGQLGAHESAFTSTTAGRDIPLLEDATEVASGVLAVPFHRNRGGWLVWFRPETVRTVRWAGDPRKAAQITGPLGARLTPRGSFAEWRETVRGTAAPWERAEVRQASRLGTSLAEVALRKSVEADRTRDLFLGMLGHDLRTPLQAISMAAKLLGEHDASRGSDRLSESISRSSRRMQRLVDHLLDLNRIRSGAGLGLESKPVDLGRLVRRIVEENEMGYPGIPLEVVVEEPLELACDPDRIEQVLANLISNARHHGRATSPIRVEARTVDGDIELSVFNEGEAIPKSMQEKLFEPYTPAVEGESRRRSGGLGLGLYISHEIVTAHRGAIEVESRPDWGTRFTVRLPCGGDETPADA